MILDAVTKSVELVLSGAKATSDCPYTASSIVGTITVYTPTPYVGTTNGTSAVTVATGPSTGALRMQEMSIYNADTAAVTVTVRINNNGTTYGLHTVTLQVGDTLGYTVGVGFYVADSTGARKAAATRTTNDRQRQVGFVIDGGASAISTGLKANIIMPYAGTIQSATLLSKNAATGAIVIDVKKSTYANFGTSSSICASAKPTITATAAKSVDATLTGWTTHFDAGDILYANVDSVTTFTWMSLSLKILTD